ncbi:MAG: hypothetical protein AAB362_03555 [Patescibacteria group bacterium]
MLEKHITLEFERRLEEEKVRIEKELSEIAVKTPGDKDKWRATYPFSDDDKSGSSSSIEDMSDEVEEYNERLSEEDTLEKRLHEINMALEKISANTYGICSVCNKDIPMERLNANPAAMQDIQHAR